MLKIAILSDTHIKNNIEELRELLVAFEDYDYLIHAGDYISYKAFEEFRKHKGFIGVYGNADEVSIKTTLKEKEMLRLKGYNIGIFHGHGDNKTTIERAIASFDGEAVDIIVYGHSHQPSIQTKNKVLLLNPGSITSKRRERWYCYIVLELMEMGVEAKLCFKAIK